MFEAQIKSSEGKLEALAGNNGVGNPTIYTTLTRPIRSRGQPTNSNHFYKSFYLHLTPTPDFLHRVSRIPIVPPFNSLTFINMVNLGLANRLLPTWGGEQPRRARPELIPTLASPASTVRPSSSAPRRTLGGKGILGGGKGKVGMGAKGLGKGGMKRHRYVG